jgi:hypothetical protein
MSIVIMPSFIMPSVVILDVHPLSGALPSLIMLRVVLLNANMPSAVISNVMSREMFSSVKRSSLLFQNVNYNQKRVYKMDIAVRNRQN